MLEVWQASTLDCLSGMLAGCRSATAGLDPRVRPLTIDGALEWTVPWGMDDGNGLVRLTVVHEPGTWSEDLRVRVVVAAGARAFDGSGTRIHLPRYTGWEYGSPPPSVELSEPDRALTRSMAEYLRKHTGGDTSSLREEPGGALSFPVVVPTGR
ncbi:hypothetical protein AB0A99_13950 [Streptomyces fradiae]|uniref:hypothetical protein n=1 Tax=Streptomyces fradiae TaxID=1906 RepID=UPI0033DA5F3A